MEKNLMDNPTNQEGTNDKALFANMPSMQEAETRSKRSRKWFLLVGGALAVGLIVCVGFCTIAFGSSFLTVITEKDDVQFVLDKFMLAMASKDAEYAYSLFSSRAKQQVPFSEIESWLDRQVLLSAADAGS
jgi:hypothetical protein